MKKSEVPNQQAVLACLNGAREALRSARFNLNGSFYGVAINRAYYVFFYAATALLLTLDLTRSKHAGVLAAFRQHFVKTGIFSVDDSRAYGEAFELRNVTDYEMLGKADEAQARAVVGKADRFLGQCQSYLTTKEYL
ncbi:MAG: HEPN domain-containing protein [Anaerolineae bacterium]